MSHIFIQSCTYFYFPDYLEEYSGEYYEYYYEYYYDEVYDDNSPESGYPHTKPSMK